jgi:TolB-like protein/two-component SAPR family response regulator
LKIEIRTLGRLGIFLDGAEVEEFAAQPVRTALLVYLALEREATRESAMALVWPDRDSGRARHALSQTLYELKRTLGESWIKAHGERLRVAECIEADAVDFAAAVEEGSFEPALALYRGPFLEGWHLKDSAEFEGWVDRQRQRLATLYREACREHATEGLARGDRTSALATARRWVEAEPLEADAQHLLIELLAESGDHQGALRQYQRYERRLRAEELTPLMETTALIERIKRESGSAGDTLGAFAAQEAILPGAERSVPRLVVLPFEHLGEPDDDYLTEGFSDELTNRLVQVPGLAVIARTSAIQYGNSDKTIAQIGRELDVDYVVEGTVRWDKSSLPNRVRISPQLIRVSDSSHLWAETHEAEAAEVFEVQADVAERVTQALDIQLHASDPAFRRRRPTRDPEAYEFYLRGYHYWIQRSESGMKAAVDLFQRAIALDPDYAQAYAGLAQVYVLFPGIIGAQPTEWYPKAKLAAQKALALDPNLAEGHAAAGYVAFLYDWDLKATEEHLSRAIELAPSYAPAWCWLGYFLCTAGRPGEARDAIARALALDPLSVATNWDIGFQYWQLRDRERAIQQYRRVQQLDPDFFPATGMLGAIQFREGNIEAARREMSRIKKLGPLWDALVQAMGDRDQAIEALDRYVELAPGPVHWYLASILYALLGEHERALHWVEGHYRNVRGEADRLETGGPGLTHMVRDPFFDGLRSHSRFIELLNRMGMHP